MATAIYHASVGKTEFSITDGVGSATASTEIELTVDLSTSIVNLETGTRQVKKDEVLIALDQLKNYILKDTTGNFI